MIRKKTLKDLKKSIIITIVFVSFFSLNINNWNIPRVAGTTEEDAYKAITDAFEVIERASKSGLDVSQYVEQLNAALENFENGNYEEAFTIAEDVKKETNQKLNSFRWDKASPYFIATLNLAVILVVVFVWGRKIWGWFKKQREEEYLELEIVYEEPIKKVE